MKDLDKTQTRPGYKNTRLGWIPEEWDVVQLSSLGDILKGKEIAKKNLTETGLPCVLYGDLYTKYDDIILEYQHFIPEDSELGTELKYNDILFAGSGEKAEDIGQNTAVLQETPARAGGDIIILRQQQYPAEFLSPLFNHPIVAKQKSRLGQGHSVVHIYGSHFDEIYIPLPPDAEMTKIADILSTWDRAIRNTEQLIAACQERKKGLMQQLLSGKTRFPGFSEPWEEVRLGDIIEVASSKRVLQKDWKNEGIPFYRTREIISLAKGEAFNTPIFIEPELFASLKEKYGIPQTGDILVTGVGTIGETYVVKETDNFYFKDGNVIWFKMNDAINSYFLHYYFKTRFVRKQLSDNASITTVSTYTIDGARKTRIFLPTPEEQLQIAKAIQSFDTELEKLESELDSLKNQKKGLMQQLLTGKVRVNTKTIAHA